jgi:hypothetical protein
MKKKCLFNIKVTSIETNTKDKNNSTVVHPYPLIQYSQFRSAAVYHGLKKNWKIKEIIGS